MWLSTPLICTTWISNSHLAASNSSFLRQPGRNALCVLHVFSIVTEVSLPHWIRNHNPHHSFPHTLAATITVRNFKAFMLLLATLSGKCMEINAVIVPMHYNCHPRVIGGSSSLQYNIIRYSRPKVPSLSLLLNATFKAQPNLTSIIHTAHSKHQHSAFISGPWCKKHSFFGTEYQTAFAFAFLTFVILFVRDTFYIINAHIWHKQRTLTW